jgi:DNA-binding NarL/FixJ family response regulator
LRLPDGLSINWLAAFKVAHPMTPAVVTSLYDDDELVFSALRAGADGYLLKGDGADHLAQALGKILRGEPPISPAIARKLMQQFRREDPAIEGVAAAKQSEVVDNAPRLTVRELEVLGLIGSGLMIKQVAFKLNLSPHTVNDNIKAIYKKLGIRSRVQAAAEAARRGLVITA